MKQFLNCNHSWSIHLNIARKLKEFGHEVHLCSTNGYDYFHDDLIENIKCKNCADDTKRDEKKCTLDNYYDLSISYTVPIHWQKYLSRGKVKFSCYNIDSDSLPFGWSKKHIFADLILPTSNFSRQTLLKSGMPKDKLIVIPHCYRDEYISRTNKLKILTDKKCKILCNIQQPHKRKNLSGILESWGKAFTNKDDVCLVFKVHIKKPSSPFEVYFPDELNKFKHKYPNHAEIVVLSDYIDYISDLYRSIDIFFSASNVEAFLLPALEGLVTKKIVIASGGEIGCGNVDFMNNDNSLLVKGKIVRMPKEYQYWTPNPKAAMFEPNTDHAAELLRLAVDKKDQLKQKFDNGMNYVIENYSADKITNKILDLYNQCLNQ